MKHLMVPPVDAEGIFATSILVRPPENTTEMTSYSPSFPAPGLPSTRILSPALMKAVWSPEISNLSGLNSAIKHFRLQPRTTNYGVYITGNNVTVDGGSTSLVAKNVIGHLTVDETSTDLPRVRTLYTSRCEGGTVRNNLMFDVDNNSDGGWTLGMYLTYASQMTFEHNTINGISGPQWIYATEVGHFNTNPAGTTHRYNIVANLSSGSMGWRWAFLGSWDSSYTLPVDYSCTYNVGNSFNTSDQVVQGTGCLINTNPLFVNPSGDNFRLQDTSPCKGVGPGGTEEMGAYGGSDPLTWEPE